MVSSGERTLRAVVIEPVSQSDGAVESDSQSDMADCPFWGTDSTRGCYRACFVIGQSRRVRFAIGQSCRVRFVNGQR